MKRLFMGFLAAGLLAAAPAPILAQEDEEPPVPQVFNDLMACQSIADDAERLACYDGRVSALRSAQEADSIMVVDREEVREAERGLFGLRLPRLFGGGEQIDAIESTITSVSGGNRSRPWRFTLEDGSSWEQIDTERMSRDPRPGHPVRIERAALGSFRAEINGMRKIRVSRVQ
ncbi:MAG: hypothetical protein ABR601_00525 [Parasphingopyxis sp.]|nr:hypothetical protein [Sphingomonadales bacterium]